MDAGVKKSTACFAVSDAFFPVIFLLGLSHHIFTSELQFLGPGCVSSQLRVFLDICWQRYIAL